LLFGIQYLSFLFKNASLVILPKEDIIIFGILIMINLLLPVARGILQGLQLFKGLGINMSIEGLGKIIFAVVLVSIGLGVNGAFIALILSSFVAFLFGIFGLRHIFKYKSEKFETSHVYNYSWPVLFSFLLLTLIYSMDVILVKFFLGGSDAGYYNGLSNLGQIIFFASFSIIQVMFPISSEMNVIETNKSNQLKVLYKSFLIVFLISMSITAFYFLFPNFIVNILYGKEYLAISPLLGYFGIFMLLFSLVNVLVFYDLSVGKLKFIPVLFFATLIEMLLIILYHNTISQIIFSLVILMSGLLLYMILYTKYSKDKNAKTVSYNTSL
jgi:O-antigen/teichoic acid export membrane protein